MHRAGPIDFPFAWGGVLENKWENSGFFSRANKWPLCSTSVSLSEPNGKIAWKSSSVRGR
jgi:hypothetical protein